MTFGHRLYKFTLSKNVRIGIKCSIEAPSTPQKKAILILKSPFLFVTPLKIVNQLYLFSGIVKQLFNIGAHLKF
jgi:hypothetical protein